MSAEAVAAVRRSLERIAARDAQVQAWEHVDAAGALAAAEHSDDGLPLSGFTLGVKDTFDVEGMPTTWGTPIYAGNIAVHDAGCVALARAAGAIVIGKTVSTEFAFLAPSRSRNPWNLAHTPGGSSSGTGAAVGDGHVRVGFGSQTMGSLLRPAAYCGAVGFKGTRGTISMDGIHPLAPSIDTLGWMTQTVADAARVRSALLEQPVPKLDGPLPKLGLLRTSAWPKAQPAMQQMVERVARELGATDADFGFDDEDDVYFPLSIFEMRQSLAGELRHIDRLRPETRALLAATEHDYAGWLRANQRLRSFDIDAAFGAFAVLLMPASPGEAPDLTSTGDPVFNRLASLLGLPAITIPVGLGPSGLPLGLQLIGRPHEDDLVLRAAHVIADRYPFPRLEEGR